MTPDSFSDGAQYNQWDVALEHAAQMVHDGADIIDIGGESTRPGAKSVALEEELERVIPLVKKIKLMNVLVSVDTSKPEVMLAAAKAGADLINDVRALSLPGALEAAAQTQLPVCLMHMQGLPDTMQNNPSYGDVTKEVMEYLKERVEACVRAGIPREYISIDPGFGFGKTLPHNLELLNHLAKFEALGLPILVGLSRKSMLGQITGREVHDRLSASLAGALIAMQNGADIIRVHDVKQTYDIKQVFLATMNQKSKTPGDINV
ncbi:dihydropteroate synthase [Aliikangiella sp. IMCC44359]|uniref:dihydropteroate synthase n=1 Tax=Aliikangiella sp. IMCC44359 TaxID=3459125 RepID=UPI00403B2075